MQWRRKYQRQASLFSRLVLSPVKSAPEGGEIVSVRGWWNLVELLPALFIFLNFLANVSCAALAFSTQYGSLHLVPVKRSGCAIKHVSYKLKWCQEWSICGKVKQKSWKRTAPVELKMKSRWQSVNCCLWSSELWGKEFGGENPSLLQGRYALRARQLTIMNRNGGQPVRQAKLSGHPSGAFIKLWEGLTLRRGVCMEDGFFLRCSV